jgi:hypothetical protein
MKIDRRLNLVLETEAPDGTPVHVHSVPISRAIWEANYRLITKTVVTLYGDGLAPGAATRVAMLYLKDTARSMDDAGLGQPLAFNRAMTALLNEIWRLSNVLMINKSGGWEALPFQEVMDKKLLDDDTMSEVENTLVFFTLASWFHQDRERQDLYTLMKAYGAQIVSSDITEFQSSLPTWTRDGNSGATGTASSIRH